MSIVLGPNRYGKAEVHVVRVTRAGGVHTIRDLTVSVALSGDMEAAHLTGDNAAVLTTDTQKNTVFAFAKEHGIASPEEFGLLLARHFVAAQPSIRHASVTIEESAWDRVGRHSFECRGHEIRTALIEHDDAGTSVASGLADLVLLNSTGSEFRGYTVDEYTTLKETEDRVLATAVNARWRHADGADAGWDRSYSEVRRDLVEAFAETYSRSLQQTLYAMGRAVLEKHPAIRDIRLSMPNRHHFAVDLEPFGLRNDNEVFYAADRPYGLIEGTVARGDGGS